MTDSSEYRERPTPGEPRGGVLRILPNGVRADWRISAQPPEML